MKKILILLSLLVISSHSVLAEAEYVSPETYAVNGADLMDYISVPAEKKTKPEKVRKIKHYKGNTINESVLMYNTKEFLQKQHKKMGTPHHGELHEIKLNSKYKNNQEK